MTSIVVAAEPEPIAIDPSRTAVVIIDMQRDFLEPGGFGETLGNDVSLLPAAIAPCQALLAGARAHAAARSSTRAKGTARTCPTRRGPRSSAARPACASARRGRWAASWSAASRATTSSPSCIRSDGEPVIDKPGKGAFYATDLHAILHNRGIENLIVCGVTTEVCVHTTVREANDRGFRCIVPADCCASYFPEFHEMGLRMIKAQGGIFGWVIGLAGASWPRSRHRTRTSEHIRSTE